MDVVKEMGKYTKITSEFAIKDVKVLPRDRLKSQVIIGTPGKVSDLIKRGNIQTRAVNVFVLDEADNMLSEQGLGDQSLRIKRLLPKECQTLLFSATFPEKVEAFAKQFAPEANEIRLRAEELTVEGIKQFYMDCKSDGRRFEVLVELYSLLTIGQSIIFVRKRETADQIASKMTEAGHTVVSLHGMQESGTRDETIDSFRAGNTKVLVTTDVLARGIDIQQVNLVINYDMPLDGYNNTDPETYLHRIGRTGRFGRQGVCINFVYDERSKRHMNTIQEIFNKEIIRVPADDLEEIEKILRKAGVR